MKKSIIKAAFISSLPVLMGYMAMGMAAGILLSSTIKLPGITFWAFLSSAVTISGALQFIMVDWIDNMLPLHQVILLTFCLNVRYAMYGLSLISRFRGIALWKKMYLIWAMTDETYALEVENKTPQGGNQIHYALAVAGFDHLYWISGVVTGAFLGTRLPFDTAGIEFAMTALFLVVLTDQCRERKNRIPAAIGILSAAVSRLIFPLDRMLIPAIILMLITFIIIRKPLISSRKRRA